jgi:hypothetical protein
MLFPMIKNHAYFLYFKTIVAVIFMMSGGLWHDVVYAQNRIHTVYYENTDYELHVYRIYGKEPGKTLLLIGGIQGDEPGGFLSADHYADMRLSRGNLIVVPRANFKSIVLQRRKINEDMNRKFAEDHNSNYETKIVTILKKLIMESDCLLNLHDGSGFFSEKWEGPDRNPMRYGQSIIADCDTYVNPLTGQTIYLGDTAQSISQQINKHIKNVRHHFHFNNHRTIEKASKHKEQRKSATYYALYTCGVQAFGIETSKSLPLEMKVRHHNLVINAFMERLEIVPETPGLNLDPPELRYLVISINDSLPVAVKNEQALHLNAGDVVVISHIEANYERGLSADIMGHGTVNDFRKKVRITGSTKIVIRKDYYPCGSIYLKLGGDHQKSPQRFVVSDEHRLQGVLFFKVRINGKEHIFQNYAHVSLIKGDTFKIVDVISTLGVPADLVVNFKGYVGDTRNNTGEDRGYVIHTDRDLWKRYSLEKKGKTYQIVITKGQQTVGKLFVDLEDPSLNYIVLQMGENAMNCLIPGDTAFFDTTKPLRLMDINTNIHENSRIKAFIVGPGFSRQQVKLNKTVFIEPLLKESTDRASLRYRIEIERDKILLGSVYLNLL